MVKKEKKISFSDSIEILTEEYDYLIYTPVFSSEIGLYLYCDDEKPIKFIELINSKLLIYYVDGGVRCLNSNVLLVNIDDSRFQRRMKSSLSGNLLRYSIYDANYYDLDVSKAFLQEENTNNKSRKRSM